MPRTRRGLQISAIFAVGLLLLATFLRPTMEQFRQRKAVAELERISSNRYQWDWAPSSPGWLYNHFNDTRKHWGDWVIGASNWQFAFDSKELDVLRRIPHLRNLGIGGRTWSYSMPHAPRRGSPRLVEGFPQLEYVSIRGFDTSASLLTIRNCTKLSNVSLHNVYTDVELSELPTLQELTVNHGNQGSRIKLSSVARLRTISVFGDSGFVRDGVFTLRDLPALESISLNHTPIRVVDLSGLPKLRQLYFDYSQLDDEVLASLGGLQQLKSLQLFHFELSDAGLEKLDNLPALESLELRGTNVTTAGLAKLARFPRLRTLTVDWSMKQAELAELHRGLPGVIIECPFRLKNKVPSAVAIALYEHE